MVFMTIIERIWANEVADEQKMLECVSNQTTWQNQLKQLSSGDDLLSMVVKRRYKINAVCEVASPAAAEETSRDLPKSKPPESRHEAPDAYLDGAEPFDYVEFEPMFDGSFFPLCPLPQHSSNALVLHFLSVLCSDRCGLPSSTHSGTSASMNEYMRY